MTENNKKSLAARSRETNAERNTVTELAERIQNIAAGILNIENPDDVKIRHETLSEALAQCFYVGQKRRAFMLSPDGYPSEFTLIEAVAHLRDELSHPISNLSDLMSQDANKSQCKALLNEPWKAVLMSLRRNNQREHVVMQVDMFAERASMSLDDPDKAVIVLTHLPLKTDAKADTEVVDDFLDHFPEFNDVLDFIVASRFAPDRKLCYLWLQCDSDWGKTFLVSALEELGLITRMTMTEAKAAYEGKPVGISAHDFRRSIVLVFDEFNAVNNEAKQLQNKMVVSAKFQLRATVEIFAKLFLSADSVGSLAGSTGIEDQFANRFSQMIETGSIKERPVFQQKGKAAYFEGVVAHTADRINAEIERYQGMTRRPAQKAADDVLEEFQERHSIDKYHERFSDSLKDVAEQFGAYVVECYSALEKVEDARDSLSNADDESTEAVKQKASRALNCRELNRFSQDVQNMVRERVFVGAEDEMYLRAPAALYELWVPKTVERSAQVATVKANEKVFQHMSADGKGNTPQRAQGGKAGTVRCIKLKNEYVTVRGVFRWPPF